MLWGMSSAVAQCAQCGTKNRVPVATQGRPTCGSCGAALPWVVPAGDADLAGALETGQVVLVDLWAPWCGPCRMVAPVLDSLAKKYAGQVKVVKVNVDEAPQTAAAYGASSIPTLVFVDGGHEVDRVIGAQPEPALAQKLDAVLAGRKS